MTDQSKPLSVDELKAALSECMRVDRYRLAQQLKKLGRSRDQNESLASIRAAVSRSIALRETRRSRQTQIRYDDALPIVEHVDELKSLIENNQVVVVCGETGSGKSTQLPKICLEMGRGVEGMIAHTQPRRLAARTLASRIAQELNSKVGDLVGYKFRFTDETAPGTAIKLLTDGMLLAETSGDRFLDQYDTIILDEAHERSLNIDFLLGVLKKLLPRRPDLRLIITSATIDPDRFSRYFDNAPVVEVSGRMFPVTVHYRPPDTDGRPGEGLQRAILDGVTDAIADGPGDVLIFLPGEREIREAREFVSKRLKQDVDLLPLYSRLGRVEQDRVFNPGTRRRIIFATNVAETSVTVPGIRYVVDPGVARINRYSPGRQVNRLPVEKISQASADQRKGRCGRVASGVCFRLYEEADFVSRDEFTTPEILRSSLADVILRMLDMGLGDIEDFPFIEAPSGKQIRDGFRLLEELGAINDERKLTRIGRQLARLPVDPRLGRMLLAGQHLGCIDEVLTITAALAVPDPRVTPFDAVDKARAMHRELDDDKSDFVSYLKIWDAWHQSMDGTSRRAGRKFCERHYLSIVRMYEWQDLRRQLKSVLPDTGKSRPGRSGNESDNDAIHQALLAGLLGNVASHHEGREYIGTRSTRLTVHPSSVARNKSPKWIMASEFLETSELFARTLAPVKPQWIEAAAGNLAKKSYSEPVWHARRGCVMGKEHVTFLGLTLVADRPVDFGKVRPKIAREVFIAEALVEGRLGRKLDFLEANLALIDDVEAMEDRFRRRDIRVNDQTLIDFYDRRLPDTVFTAAALESWWRDVRDQDPNLLDFDLALVSRDDTDSSAVDDYPQTYAASGVSLSLEYRFEPGAPDDGVTAIVPLEYLNRLQVADFQWLVPGLIKERLVSVFKSLPKQTRTRFVPVPDTVDRFIAALDEDGFTGDLGQRLTRFVKSDRGVDVRPGDWQFSEIPEHLQMRFRLIDGDGKTLATGRDLDELKAEHSGAAAKSFSSSASFDIERDGIVKWDFGELPASVALPGGAGELTGFPALVDMQEHCAIRVFDSPDKAQRLTRQGLRRLLLLELPGLRRMLERKLPDIDKICLLYSPVGACDELKQDISSAALDACIGGRENSIRTGTQFEELKQLLKKQLPQESARICRELQETLASWHDTRTVLAEISPLIPQATVADVTKQLDSLVYTGFVASTPVGNFSELPRYLKAIAQRLKRAQVDPSKDLQRHKTIANTLVNVEGKLDEYRETGVYDELRWMIEELRVSTFAQELGTAIPISVKRIEKRMDKIQKTL